MVKTTAYVLLSLLTFILPACEEEDSHVAQEVKDFYEHVSARPVMISGIKLGDSWRAIKQVESWEEDGKPKESTSDFINNPSYKNYREYWIFDVDAMVMTYAGEAFGRDWNGYYAMYAQQIDFRYNRIRIENTDNQMEQDMNWTINWLSNEELILTSRDDQDHFYEYTFRREKFH